MQCNSLQSKTKYIYIVSMYRNSIPLTALSFTVQQITDLQCTAMYWTAPPTLHYTALHLEKFEIQFIKKIYKTLLICFYKKSSMREGPNISNNANRRTDTKTKLQKTRIFLLFWGIWLSGVGLLCTLQQSTGLYLNPLNYTALH